MKFAFLLPRLAGYFSVCLEALARLPDTEVMVVCQEPSNESPYDLAQIDPKGVTVKRFRQLPDGETVEKLLKHFEVDVLMVCGWQIRPYRYAARQRSGSALRVLLMDNQWHGTAKQHLGIIASPRYIHPFFDFVFLPGQNQEVFARKLGFKNHQIWRGYYSCDQPRFYEGGLGRSAVKGTRNETFLFVGRLVASKGVATLVEAYKLYRSACSRPWNLDVCGTGPLASAILHQEGVNLRGFVQPSHLTKILGEAGCLVLPSLFEPWGVIIHEAAAAGLPVICTNACGAAPQLVEDSTSGYLVQAGSADELAKALLRFHSLTPSMRDDMGETGRRLSFRYTPELWASILRRRCTEALQEASVGQ